MTTKKVTTKATCARGEDSDNEDDDENDDEDDDEGYLKDDDGATIQWIEDNPVYALGAWVSPCFPPTALQGKIKDKWLVNMGPPLCALRRLTYSASDRGAVWELG